jgi:hypothetical protein
MIFDNERLPAIFEVAEAGALIQRHLGQGGVYEAINAADDYVRANINTEDRESAEAAQATYLVGYARGLSDNHPIPPEELRAGLRAVA